MRGGGARAAARRLRSPRSPRKPPPLSKESISQRLEAQRRSESQRFDDWFDAFDGDAARKLDRGEFRHLLRTMQPGAPEATDETLERLMAEVRQTGLTREGLRGVVLKNLAYIREAQVLEGIFEKFDEDRSGFLERDELKRLMFSVSQGDVVPHAAGDPNAARAKRVAFKLRGLDALHRKGVLDDAQLAEKRKRVQQRQASDFFDTHQERFLRRRPS